MKHLFILGFIFSCILASGQTPASPTEIKFDFERKNFTSDFMSDLKKLQRGQFYQLKIENINLNLYDVNVVHKDSTIASNVSIPTLGSLGMGDIVGLISSIIDFTSVSLSGQSKEIIDEKEALSNLEKDVKDIESKLSGASKSFIDGTGSPLSENMKNLDKVKNKKDRDQLVKYFALLKEICDLKEKIKKMEAMTNLKENIIAQINASGIKLKESLGKTQDSVIQPVDSLILQMNMLRLKYYSLDGEALKCLKIESDLCVYLEKILIYRSKLNDKKPELQKIKSLLDKYISGQPDGPNLMKKDSTLKAAYASFEGNLTKAIGILDKAMEQINAEKITAFMNAVIHLENNKSRIWTSMPIQFMGDMGSFKLSFTPKSAEYGLSSFSQEYVFKISKAYKGVSAGFYYAPKAVNERYSIKDTLDTNNNTVFGLVKEDDSGEIGFTTLFHYGRKLDKSEKIGVHVSVGPAVSLSSVIRPRLNIGGGLSFGNYNGMFTIDALLMTGFYDKLSNAFSIDGQYSTKPEQVTVSKLKAHVAVSVGYIYKF